jgi:hypothetical protein
MIHIINADHGMIASVLDNLRVDDALELGACEVNLGYLPETIMRHKVFAFCAVDPDIGPLAVWGMTQRRSGVGAGFAFGTQDWGASLLPMLRQIREFVIPFLREAGYHRVEAAALARRDDVARFMRLIGAEPEALLRGYGSAGEDFISYRWLRDEYAYDHIQKAEVRSHATH